MKEKLRHGLPVAARGGRHFKNCIHFLNTGSSDAILLESGGHFALIDAGEDNDNPRGFAHLNFKGYEEEVLAYLKTNAADKTGRVKLDFVLGTHSHSDHIGGFDTILLDKDVTVGRAYLKEYKEEEIRDKEVNEWDNKEVYQQMADALRQRNIPVISEPDGTPFMLGDFKLTLFNTEDDNQEKVGENDNSLGVLVELNGAKIFLAGDIDNITGDEDRLAPMIGRVDLLKVGHHSYNRSTTDGWLTTLMPSVCVVTNNNEQADKNTLERITKIVHSPILLTGEENGVIAEIKSDGAIAYYHSIY